MPFPPTWQAAGWSVRPAQQDDLPWLLQLYASSRDDELRHVPWPDATKAAFVQSQFALQHQHFTHAYAPANQAPQAHWWIVNSEHNGMKQAVGRLYWNDGSEDLTVIDIGLLPGWRSQGLGTTLLHFLQARAADSTRTVVLHVAHSNPGAQRLYQRLGFSLEEDVGSHWRMRWHPRASVS